MRTDHTLGLKHIKDVYMKPLDIKNTPKYLSEFKQKCRNNIENEHGVEVIANIGDQWHDVIDMHNRELRKQCELLSRENSHAFFVGDVVHIKLPTRVKD